MMVLFHLDNRFVPTVLCVYWVLLLKFLFFNTFTINYFQITAKKNVNLKRKSEESSANSGPTAKKIVEKPSPRTNAVIDSWPPKSGKVLDSWPPRPKPKDNCSDKKKKLSVQDVEASNFKAHDYSEESLHMFTGRVELDQKHNTTKIQPLVSDNYALNLIDHTN